MKLKITVSVFLSILFIGCKNNEHLKTNNQKQEISSLLYMGGNIITMDGNSLEMVHSNGDKGIQQVLDFLKLDQKRNARNNHRFTLHHMGYYTDEMAQEIKDLGVEASVNPYYLRALADKYSENGLGKERGNNLVRINSLVKRRIPVSFHSDFSMAPMEPLTLAWTAINRVTSENNSVSPDQKIPVFDAMRAITIDAARTLNLEKQIGSIAEGKRANLVILNKSPFIADPIEIKNIKVLATIFEGGFHIVKSNNLKGGKTK